MVEQLQADHFMLQQEYAFIRVSMQALDMSRAQEVATATAAATAAARSCPGSFAAGPLRHSSVGSLNGSSVLRGRASGVTPGSNRSSAIGGLVGGMWGLESGSEGRGSVALLSMGGSSSRGSLIDHLSSHNGNIWGSRSGFSARFSVPLLSLTAWPGKLGVSLPALLETGVATGGSSRSSLAADSTASAVLRQHSHSGTLGAAGARLSYFAGSARASHYIGAAKASVFAGGARGSTLAADGQVGLAGASGKAGQKAADARKSHMLPAVIIAAASSELGVDIVVGSVQPLHRVQ